MGAFDKFEQGVENAVAGAFAKAFKSDLKPVEILSALKKRMDKEAATLKRDRTVAPNDFTVYLGVADYDKVQQWGTDALAGELVDSLTEYGTEQDYVFLGPLRVTFVEDDTIREGSLRTEGTTKRGSVAPATSRAASSAHPMIEIGKDRYLLTGAVTVLGRGSDCDIIVDDTGISRHHLELRVTPGGVIATDLGSTNGSFVEGHRISAATLVDGNTITIGRTHIMFWSAQADV